MHARDDRVEDDLIGGILCEGLGARCETDPRPVDLAFGIPVCSHARRMLQRPISADVPLLLQR